jgi:penicillin amidase
VLRVELGGTGWPSAVSASRTLFEAATTLLLSDGLALLPGVSTEHELAEVLGSALDTAASELAADLGSDPAGWRWERRHTMVSPHPLADARPELTSLHPPVDGCGGDGDTVRCGAVIPVSGDRMAAGSVARYVFDLSDWDRSGWVVPHGVSGVRGSGHDLDQRAPWLAGELVPMVYSPGAVALAATSEHRVEMAQ